MNQRGYVYFFKNPQTGLTKIGYSHDPHTRKKTLEAEQATALEVSLVLKAENPFVLEQSLHELERDRWVQGEWFNLNDSLEGIRSQFKASLIDWSDVVAITPPVKDLDYYLGLRYPLVIRPMEHGETCYYAVYPDFGGAAAHGDGETVLAAVEEATISKELTIKSLFECGEPIPLPCTEFSGKFLVRTSPDLHRDLALRARLEGVSLNQFCVYLLSKSNL